jgi:hypothetical protein
MKLFFFLLLFLSSLIFAKGHATQYENPFSIVYGGVGTNIYGDYVSLASSVQCVKKDDGTCDNNYNGNLYDATTKQKNSVSVAKIPLNSSTEILNLPSDVDGADILYAGLYWQGHIAGTDAANYSTGITGRDKVSFIDADNVIHTLTADKIWYHDFWGDGIGSNGGYRSFYQGYRDVTSLLQNSYTKGQTNAYTVGDIKSTSGADHYQYFWTNDAEFDGIKMGFWGNWNLIVVYKHPNIALLSPRPKPKNITIFQGFDALIPLPTNTASQTNKSITLDLNGFLTPNIAPINAKLLFYGSGGEKQLNYDSLQIQDKKTTNYVDLSNAANPADDAFNDSVSKFGNDVNSSISYYPGLDSDDFNVSSAMDTKQTSTSLKLTAKWVGHSGDQFFPGVIAFSTDIYEPVFCYDYAYQQQKVYFTEDNDGSQNPKITGNVIPEEDVNVTIFIRNLVDSDLQVQNMKVDITDINTTQADYINDSIYLTKTGELSPTFIPDSTLITGTNFIKDIPIGDMSSNDYFYLYYALNPKVTTLNMPIHVKATYDLVVNGNTTVPYTLTVGDNLKMCSSTNFKYTPQKGLFNIVNDTVNTLHTGSPNGYYNNLPTVVTQKADNYKVLAYDANDTNLNTLTDTNVTVHIELIDAAAFHSTFASCKEPTSSISDKITVTFNNSNNTPFRAQEIVNHILTHNGTNSDTEAAKKFYQTARENAAFRISWNTDVNGSEIRTITDSTNPNSYHLENFSDYATQDCVSPVTTDVDSGGTVVTKTYRQVSEACFNAGTSSASSMNDKELAACMQCIYGKNLHYLCSRDNFSIRPEAFLVQLDDQNQTNSSVQQDITTLADSGSAGATATPLHLAADYKYNIEINATNHYNNDASPGYTKTMNVTNADTAQYIWDPRSITAANAQANCNDDLNKSITMRFVNGIVDRNTSVSQVGEYKLSIKDTTWTTVDSNPFYMTHHDGDPYFLPSSYADCTPNSTIVPLISSSSALNGCEIESQHLNTHYTDMLAGVLSLQYIQYNDYNVTFHPYKFSYAPVLTIGPGRITPPATLPFVYMANIGAGGNENMAVHIDANISAVGKNSATPLSNFVKGCFEKPLNISIDKSPTGNTALVYRYRFHDYNSTGTLLSLYDKNNTIAAGNVNDDANITTASGSFQKDLNGRIITKMNLNYDRVKNVGANPEYLTFIAYKVSNSDTFHADLNSKKTANNSISLNNKKIIHYYGRAHSKRVTIECKTAPCQTNYDPNLANNPDHTRVFIYFEVYCNKLQATNGNICTGTLLPPGTENTDDKRFWINLNHDISVTAGTDGIIGSVKESSASAVTELNQTMITKYKYESVLKYDGSQTPTFPYSANMENNASNWLIYDESNATATTNKFRVDFVQEAGWNGVHETNTTTHTRGAAKTNRRLMW